MIQDTELARSLLTSLRHALQPRRFPVRRDIEVAGAAASSDYTAFHDYMLIGTRAILLVAARLPGGSLNDAMAAVAVRELIRATAQVVETPVDALKLISSHIDGLDIALARIDLANGRLSTASAGQAGVDRDDGQLQLDSSIWLWAGDTEPYGHGDRERSLADCVDDSITTLGETAVCALLLKGLAGQKSRAIFSAFNEQSEIPKLITDLKEHMAGRRVPEAIMDMMDLALDEILSNCINYGFRDSASHEIIVEADVGDDVLTLEIRDDGIPFDPLSVAPPDLDASLENRQVGGLGMHFVRTLLDNITYTRSSGWNVLRLTKSWGPGSDGGDSL